jgi:YegS/Rv2252/BmrU family lipid kinase
MPSRVLLNPGAGRGRGARLRERVAALARRAAIPMEESADAADLAARASRAAAEGVERLIVAGGDGTWHHAARGLAGSATALAPLPAGTGNDLARSLGFPLALEPAFAAALELPLARIDLGDVDGQPYCGVAGAGFDGAVAEYARARVRRLRGPAVYTWATLATLASFRPPRATIDFAGGERLEEEVYFVAFANTPFFGGGMRVAPAADPGDGALDMVIVRRISKLRLLALFPRVYLGRHVGHAACRIERVAGARLAFDRPQFVVGDGERIGTAGTSGVAFSLRPQGLAVVRRPRAGADGNRPPGRLARPGAAG